MARKLTKQERQTLCDHRAHVYEKYVKPCEQGIYCPFLEKDVVIDKRGWEHLSGISKPREFQEQRYRLSLVKNIAPLIARSGTCQQIRYDDGKTYFAFEGIIDYDPDKQKSCHKICVVCLKTDGVITIFSVHAMKQK